jgi:hypothetical protein
VQDPSLSAYDPLNPNLPSSSFASRAPLKHQQLVDEDAITPGPGSYAPAHQFRNRRVPEAHQFFGSTALRPYQVRRAACWCEMHHAACLLYAASMQRACIVCTMLVAVPNVPPKRTQNDSDSAPVS